MGWFSERRVVARVTKEQKEVNGVLLNHLDGFMVTHRDVEAWLEQPTGFNKPSILLMTADGESIRHAIPSVAFGHDFAFHHDIPAYDTDVVPYPQHMHEYGARSKRISG